MGICPSRQVRQTLPPSVRYHAFGTAAQFGLLNSAVLLGNRAGQPADCACQRECACAQATSRSPTGHKTKAGFGLRLLTSVTSTHGLWALGGGSERPISPREAV